ncbi:retrovirus-related Pol polyprotein from transposon 412 [Trichonephila clavipes]|nr:retrovirus-related Pol polyprotein from transposon 412 [Trichonephila clavipes]
MFCLGYQSLIPVYHPQANPVERKNRDLKPRLATMVGNNHTLWIEKLPAIRFALNTSKCESTDHTAAYLTFARELRTLDQVNTDLRSVIHNDNFVPEFTPYLKRFEGYMSQIKENIEMSQDRQKTYADKSRRPSPNYKVNDLVWVKLHPLSKASQNRSAKLVPRRDGPYIVLSQRSPTTFVVASCDKPDEPLGVYHISALTPFLNGTETQSPVVPLKKRGRPRKQPLVPRGTAGENAIMSASTPPRRDGLRRLFLQYYQRDEDFKNFISSEGITWKFIVELAPWRGGFYERLMRSIKELLRKIIGRAQLTFEGTMTILAEIENVLNHRPLTYVSDDISDPEPFTPASFLLVGHKNEYPFNFSELLNSSTTRESLLKRKHYQTKLLSQFWSGKPTTY